MARQSHATQVQAVESACDTRGIVRGGYMVIGMFLLLFVVWASTMSLSTAAIAPGMVGVEGQKKQVQHLNGGVVEVIHVRNGDQVEEGQVLVTLDSLTNRSRLNTLENERIQLAAELARWQAVYDSLPEIEYPAWMVSEASQERVRHIQLKQDEILKARRRVFEETMRGLAYVQSQAAEEGSAAQQRQETLTEKYALVQREIREYQRLEKQGLVTRVQVFDLQNELTDLKLDLDEARSLVGLSEQRREQAESQIKVLANTLLSEAAENSTAIGLRLTAIEEELATVTSEVSRSVVRSPITGQILNSAINTVGGVISPGQTLMEVMPTGERLLIESLVDPKDRDAIHVGQRAEVRFSALDKRTTLPVEGIVTMISADSQVAPNALLPRYTATIELQDDEASPLQQGQIHPGMQAEVLIITGKQTLLDYFISPIANSVNRALRES
ncbi:HlyD family type I secretion periplasmic adaptor subunit [Granulosicoccus sp. 3-233]|uniref:HlyD family type I secretion periplasmic adaptor subunit n=1 Tax=Granulosicoccus sp. 3-233 TaxID=3417969 RepID=UPI003D33A5F3